MLKIQGEVTLEGVKKIGIVTSRWNGEIIERLEVEALKRLDELSIKDDQIILVRVPGAIEIPFAVKNMIELGCEGVVALGAVIRGETGHYDIVCNSVERGCTQLQLEYNTPVALGVLTTENREQALARSGGDKENKGREVVDVVLEMINLKKQIKKQSL